MNRRGFLLAAALAACTHARASAPAGSMPNGLYKVLAYPAAREGPPAVRYDPKLADPARSDSVKWVTLDTSDYVPLVLETKPRAIGQADGRIGLEITLAKEHVPTLEGFTRRNVGGLAAVVLDGEIVTVHKERAIITDGRMQITRCTDRACEKLLTKLGG
jgi:hypothetical protein